MTEKDKQKYIRQMSTVGIAGNIILTVFKLIAGLIGKSSAMVSDAVHSSSDVFGTLAAFFGAKLSEKEADKSHPYGHERLECVASIILALILLITGIVIGYNGVMDIIRGIVKEAPGIVTIIAAVVSIVTKEAMFHYTRITAKKINSAVFIADAWHHRTDAISSVGALIGIVGARLGVLWLDSAASIVICAFIIYIAVKIFLDATGKMVDHSCSEEFEKELSDFILQVDEIKSVDLLQTRMFGEKIYVDLEISVDGSKTLFEAHDIADDVHEKVEKKYDHIKHIMIHVNPWEES